MSPGPRPSWPRRRRAGPRGKPTASRWCSRARPSPSGRMRACVRAGRRPVDRGARTSGGDLPDGRSGGDRSPLYPRGQLAGRRVQWTGELRAGGGRRGPDRRPDGPAPRPSPLASGGSSLGGVRALTAHLIVSPSGGRGFGGASGSSLIPTIKGSGGLARGGGLAPLATLHPSPRGGTASGGSSGPPRLCTRRHAATSGWAAPGRPRRPSRSSPAGGWPWEDGSRSRRVSATIFTRTRDREMPSTTRPAWRRSRGEAGPARRSTPRPTSSWACGPSIAPPARKRRTSTRWWS